MTERTLPIRVPIISGESLDSWLETLARRNGLTVRELLQELGWPLPRNRFSLVQDIPAGILRRMERQSGLPPGRLDEAVLDQYLPLGWARDSGRSTAPTACRNETADGCWPGVCPGHSPAASTTFCCAVPARHAGTPPAGQPPPPLAATLRQPAPTPPGGAATAERTSR